MSEYGVAIELDLEHAVTLLAAVRAARRAHGSGTRPYDRLVVIDEALSKAICASERQQVIDSVPLKVAGVFQKGSGV